MAVVFVVGPQLGLIMQPLIEVLADNCESRFGRRRPYIKLGIVICTAAMLLLGFTRPVASIFTFLLDGIMTLSPTRHGWHCLEWYTHSMARRSCYLPHRLCYQCLTSGRSHLRRYDLFFWPNCWECLGCSYAGGWQHRGLLCVRVFYFRFHLIFTLRRGNIYLPWIFPFLGKSPPHSSLWSSPSFSLKVISPWQVL